MHCDDIQTQIRALAEEALCLVRAALTAQLRFLEPALCRLALRPDPEATLASDGQTLWYGPRFVLRRWKESRESLLRAYLHTVLHCLYHHPFVDGTVAVPVWDLACDLAVESLIDSLKLPGLTVERDPAASQTLAALRSALQGRLTAERIYHYYNKAGNLSGPALEALRQPFLQDDHALWYDRRQKSGEEQPGEEGRTDTAAGRAGGERRPGPEGEEQPGSGAHPRPGDPHGPAAPHPAEGQAKTRAPESVKAQWNSLSALVQADLEAHARRWGDRAGELLWTLQAVHRKKTDYRDFLRRFSVLTEVLHPDEDTFDLICYTYGLRLYGDLPLVEPLETTEARRIRTFVVVVDTSASVQGDKVKAFLRCTCGVLLQPQSYAAQAELHVLECDAAVQRDTCLRTAEEVDAFVAQLSCKGGGGTDFRPAFDYVERLLAEGALQDLRGILYFTDGDGTWPQKPPSPPDCRVAFVFAGEQDAARAAPPPWAIRAVLDTEDEDCLTLLE